MATGATTGLKGLDKILCGLIKGDKVEFLYFMGGGNAIN